jgi:hypothetical protein
MRDEGALFSQVNHLNTTTTQDFEDYFNTVYWPKATQEQMARLSELYPQDPAAGSPYDTGLLNAISPQYKRISSLNGDYSFHSQRRQLLQKRTWQKIHLFDRSIPH